MKCNKCGKIGHKVVECPNRNEKSDIDKCYICGQKGHKARNCLSENKIKCFHCGKEGHKAATCPLKIAIHK